VPARLRAFRGARRHLDSFASFELFDHDGPVGIELHCSRRSPSKLTISFTLSERTLLGQTPHAATMKVCSLDQQPLSIKIKRTGARTLRPVAIVLSGSRMRQSGKSCKDAAADRQSAALKQAVCDQQHLRCYCCKRRMLWRLSVLPWEACQAGSHCPTAMPHARWSGKTHSLARGWNIVASTVQVAGLMSPQRCRCQRGGEVTMAW
jgi:hypothetical protein